MGKSAHRFRVLGHLGLADDRPGAASLERCTRADGSLVERLHHGRSILLGVELRARPGRSFLFGVELRARSRRASTGLLVRSRGIASQRDTHTPQASGNSTIRGAISGSLTPVTRINHAGNGIPYYIGNFVRAFLGYNAEISPVTTPAGERSSPGCGGTDKAQSNTREHRLRSASSRNGCRAGARRGFCDGTKRRSPNYSRETNISAFDDREAARRTDRCRGPDEKYRRRTEIGAKSNFHSHRAGRTPRATCFTASSGQSTPAPRGGSKRRWINERASSVSRLARLCGHFVSLRSVTIGRARHDDIQRHAGIRLGGHAHRGHI
jgi:hypothetical protein